MLTALAAANEKSEELITALNRKIQLIKDLKDAVVVRSVNLRHIFHGDLTKNGKPTGCHHNLGRCCFRLQKMFTDGKDTLFDVVKVYRNSLHKTSSIFPWEDTSECMDKAIEVVKDGQFMHFESEGSAITFFFQNTTKTMGMSFRINKTSLDSFFLQIINFKD